MNPKCVLVKTLKKFGKPGKIFEKITGNPVYIQFKVFDYQFYNKFLIKV